MKVIKSTLMSMVTILTISNNAAYAESTKVKNTSSKIEVVKMDSSEIEAFKKAQAIQGENKKVKTIDTILTNTSIVVNVFYSGESTYNEAKKIANNLERYELMFSIRQLETENKRLKSKKLVSFKDEINRNEILISRYKKDLESFKTKQTTLEEEI